MPYDNLAKVAFALQDGNLRTKLTSSQPEILVLGPADSGLTYERFIVNSISAAEREFGAESVLLKGIHEVAAQGSDNIRAMRVGGRQGVVLVADDNSGTLTITTEYRGDEILDRYSLIILEGTDTGTNRYVIWDVEDDQWVFDSEEILTLNEGVIDVDDSSFGLFTVGDVAYPEAAPLLADLVSGDFTATGDDAISTVTITAGSDGTSVSLPEKYAALNTAYHLLDFKDADYVVPKGVYIDDQNAVDGDTCNYFKGVPAFEATNDTLGYLWQYIYQGKLYTYFVDRADYFTAETSADYADRTVNTNLILTADKTGTGGNSISYVSSAAGAAGPTVTISEPTPTSLLISLVDDGSNFTDDAVIAINAALAAYTLTNGQLASTLVTASGGSGAQAIATVVSIALTGGLGGHVLTHEDLTGDAIPAAVSTKFAAGVDAELREANFAHQLASFCHLASSQWKAMLGAISVKAPTSFSRSDIASWVGEPPVITTIGDDDAIDVPADNGNGLFSIKLMAGDSETSNGYRAALIEDGNSTDGYAYGGIILTVGDSLPNGSDWAYGISDSDEAVDSNNKPVDLGRYIHVLCDWVIHRNAWNGGVIYRGDIAASTLGVLAVIPENEEPIGISYPLKKITGLPKVHSVQKDSLSQFRFCPLKLEEGVGHVFAGFHTGAHPQDSDFVDSSTMRVVNRIANGIRRIAMPFLGKPFDSLRLASLQQEVDGLLRQERVEGMHQGAVAPVSFTSNGRVLGQLNINLTLVPPFSIKQINVPFSLAADETELT
jgi:hypothetical protein